MKRKKQRELVIDRNVKVIEQGIVSCFFDGSCEPYNPGGEMGFGAVIKSDGVLIAIFSDKIPKNETNTNNVAEYCSLKWVLNRLIELKLQDSPIIVYGDSSLVIHQMKGLWKIKKGYYKNHAEDCINLKRNFSQIAFKWIPRELNEEADSLSKPNTKTLAL